MKRTETETPRLLLPFQAWGRFWLTPMDPLPLHVLRVLCGLLFLAWLVPLSGHIPGLFGTGGWFDVQAFKEASRLPEGSIAPMSWSVLYLFRDNAQMLQAFYIASVGVLALFTIGIAPRVTGVLTWVVVASFITSPVTNYEADYLLVILAFYLMLGYLGLGQWGMKQSPLERVLGPWRKRERTLSHSAGLVVRLVQVHVVIILLTSGFHKLQYAAWWSGVAFWYPLNPPYEITRESMRQMAPKAQSILTFLSLIQYIALAWQLTFPLFAWKQGAWRLLLLGGGAIGWIGGAIIYRQPLFGPVLMIGCLSFLRPEEWQRALDVGKGLLFRLRSRKQEVSREHRGGVVHV